MLFTLNSWPCKDSKPVNNNPINVPKTNNYKAFITASELFTHTSKYDSVMSSFLRKSYLSPHIYSVESSIKKYKEILKKKKEMQAKIAALEAAKKQ